MSTNVPPICRALIALFAATREPLTIDTIEKALPNLDSNTVRGNLHGLVCEAVVRQAIRRPDERLVYWLAGSPIEPFDGTLFHYAPDAAFADVGGVGSISGTRERHHG